MDIQPQTTKPISDDQELAKVLAGVSRDADNNLSFEETPVSSMPVPTTVVEAPTKKISVATDGDNLDDIKKTALSELRPLVDKLNLSAEDKFDIYLLMLRSTDDKTLIAPAHATAQDIADESKRAQALLDIIKEIDYLSNPPQINN